MKGDERRQRQESGRRTATSRSWMLEKTSGGKECERARLAGDGGPMCDPLHPEVSSGSRSERLEALGRNTRGKFSSSTSKGPKGESCLKRAESGDMQVIRRRVAACPCEGRPKRSGVWKDNNSVNGASFVRSTDRLIQRLGGQDLLVKLCGDHLDHFGWEDAME